MMLLGSAILKASLTDLYLRYVKEGLRAFLIAAGVLLIAAAIMTTWYELRAADTAHGDEDGHGHTHHEPRVGWLLILPVLGLLFVAPPALGSYATGQAGTVSVTRAADWDYSLPPGDPVPISLLDYSSLALFDEGKSLAGRNVRLTGFVTPGPDGKPMLVRMKLTCCAADGRPIKVGLTGAAPVGVPADTWIQTVGVYSSHVEKDPVNQATVPFLEVTTWRKIAQPRQPYE